MITIKKNWDIKDLVDLIRAEVSCKTLSYSYHSTELTIRNYNSKGEEIDIPAEDEKIIRRLIEKVGFHEG